MKEYFNQKEICGAEIGVDMRNNSLYIFKQLNVKNLILVDTWNDYPDYISKRPHKENYKLILDNFKLNPKIWILRGFSREIVKEVKNNSLDFVYIDANHRYDYVYEDIELWYNKVKVGGIIAGHDINIIDVIRVVKDFCYKKCTNFFIEKPDWYFYKKEVK